MNKVVLSFFDLTGYMVWPWLESGYDAILFDLQHMHYMTAYKGYHNTRQTVSKDILTITNYYLEQMIGLRKVVFASFFPPCTDLAVSGARHFAAKKQRDPSFQKKAMDLVYKSRDIGRWLNRKYNTPWMIENPVSVISTFWRKPNYTFHPYEYGGYLPQSDTHPMYPKYIPPRDAYTKKTCLWTSDNFIMPVKQGVPIKSNFIHKSLGGKSLKTKNIRSATPRGFAKAVYLSNLGVVK